MKLEDMASTPKQGNQLQTMAATPKRQTLEEMANPIEDSREITPLSVAGEFAAAANRSVMDFADLVTSPVRGAFNLGSSLMGSEARMPAPSALWAKTPGASGTMPQGAAKEVTAALGTLVPLAGALAPIQRAAGTTTNVAKEFLGFGTTELQAQQKLAESTARAIQAMDDVRLGKEVLQGTEEIYEEAKRRGLRNIVERNRGIYDEVESVREQVKKGKAEETDIPEIDMKPNLSRIADEMYEAYGIPHNNTLKTIAKNGGLKYDVSVEDLTEIDKVFTRGAQGSQKPVNWYDRTFYPVAEALKKYSDPRVGGAFERAVETAVRNTSLIADNLGRPIQKVIRLVDEDLELKRLFLDVGRDPKLMRDIRARIRQGAGQDGLTEFDKFLKASTQKNSEALRHLFVREGGFDDVYYFHTQKKPEKGVRTFYESVRSRYSGKGARPEALKVRTRKPAAEMDDVEVGMYQNPLATQLKYLSDQEVLLEMAKKFNIRPSLSKNSNVTDFFDEISKKLQRDGFDEDTAKGSSDLMLEAYMGAKKAPHPAVRSFMSLAYAGTLAQLKTALLNLHDVAVAMTNQGAMPTMRALIQSTNGQFGKTVKQLGIGDNQSVGEFVQEFDKFIATPSGWEKAAKQSKGIANAAMSVSGFKALDTLGKGTVLRATVNRARNSAANNTLFRDFGHLMTKDELRAIRPYLKSRTPPKDMPENARRLVEELAFTGLGEQQLISFAGRPLNYLRMPLARPLYALTGFAIKQQAMLRKNVVDEITKGNYGKAGEYAAKYTVYAGLGYGIIEEVRSSVFKREEFEPEDIFTNAVDQVAAAITLNKLGDDYGRSKFIQDPVKFTIEGFLPPTGLVGAAAQDVAAVSAGTAGALGLDNETAERMEKMIFRGEYSSKVAERFPLIGDFYKYYWKDE